MNTKHLIAANEAHADAHQAMRDAAHADFDAQVDEMNRAFEAEGFFDDEPTDCEAPCGAWRCQGCHFEDDDLPF